MNYDRSDHRPIYLSKPQAQAGLLVWLLLLPGVAWLASPTIRSWADVPPNQFQVNWPQGQWPAGMAPLEAADLDPEDRDGDR
jgi:hypothetical protein